MKMFIIVIQHEYSVHFSEIELVECKYLNVI